jgi:GH15 family glucan-1,4-alpha-glucosidase
MVLRTTFRSPGGEAELFDCLTIGGDGGRENRAELLRVVEGTRGHVELRAVVSPRFDYGAVRPWLRQHGVGTYSAIGGNDALLVSSDAELQTEGRHDLVADMAVRAQQRLRLRIAYANPEDLDADEPATADPEAIDQRLEAAIEWWRQWSQRANLDAPEGPGAMRSAVVVKALTHRPTGAVVAAPTTSLPEAPRGPRNWDYRFSWIRDSVFSVRSLADLGYPEEAESFRRFVMRSAAGDAEELQIMFGVAGERRLTELELEHLEGYGGARPVRIGNAAAGQVQLDVYGELLNLNWRWHQRGNSPTDDEWRFLVGLVEAAIARWRQPDRGIWEWRGKPLHFVHSKVMCWGAVDRGLRLAEECMRKAPIRRWEEARRRMRAEIERRGYDSQRRTFVQAFGKKTLDAALLLLPTVDFVAYDDERMVSTVDAVRDRLNDDGLIRRYDAGDRLRGKEGAFLACSFWLAECLARQHRRDEAQVVFDRAVATSNGLGLFSEEYDPKRERMLGNFPQALTHLSHMAAAVALSQERKADDAPSGARHQLAAQGLGVA